MKRERRVFSPEDRLAIIQEGQREGTTVTCRKYNLAPSLYAKWKNKYLSKGVEGLKPAYKRIDPELRALEEENDKLSPSLEEQLNGDFCCSKDEQFTTQNNKNEEPHQFVIIKMFLPSILSFVLLILPMIFESSFSQNWFVSKIKIAWYAFAYLPVGLPVIIESINSIRKGDIFSEFMLMSIATIGAFSINQYSEAVAVMLFYSIGEIFQNLAAKRVKSNIKSLLDQRPDEVYIISEKQVKIVKAESVRIGDIIQLKPGDKLGLDGELLTEKSSFNSAALTGESQPETKAKGDSVLAGMINLNSVTLVKVTKSFSDSKLSKILELVQNANSQKAPTELFIRKFAKIYTPIIVLLGILKTTLPFFIVENYIFSVWLYRALVFLVISCPCALVISIPLGYFGGIGAASRNGILIKGSNFLDVLANIKNVVMDKTGTMTEGVFKVQEVVFNEAYNKKEILQMVNILESHSSHPIATAIKDYVGDGINQNISLTEIEELAGYGLKAITNGKELLVGNFKLLDKFSINYEIEPDTIVFTVIAVAFNKKFVGYITIADSIKNDALLTIEKLKTLNVRVTMLSGDKSKVVNFVAKKLGINNAFGDLLPIDKVNKVKGLIAKNESVAFVGDGMNDAPVIALSDVGIAMGGLGSDATIETADVIIQDDKPSKIPIAIVIGKETKKIVWQNISIAFGVKAIVLVLGAWGLASMWEAVFADVGVALIAILNAVRIQRMKFR